MRFFIPLFLFFIDLSLFAFNFFPCKKRSVDFFWHLKIPTLQFLPTYSDKIIKVAVLDTFFDQKTIMRHQGLSKSFNLKRSATGEENLSGSERFKLCNHFPGGDGKSSTFSNNEGVFFHALGKKNHGVCAATLIQQIAPQVEIISIPIFNDQGMTSKKKLCDGLQQALGENVDILYLGLKVAHDDQLDQEIMRLLSSFSYVVVAAGNDAKYEKKLAFPACASNIFFSVGAFEKVAQGYMISDFSQFQQNVGPNFVMPGKDLICQIWSDLDQDFVPCVVSGTSMAAALFVGYLAHILMIAKQNFSAEHIQYILKKNSVMLNEKKWAGKVKFGTLFMRQIIRCMEKLQHVEIKMLQKKHMKKFEKKVREIVQELSENN